MWRYWRKTDAFRADGEHYSEVACGLGATATGIESVAIGARTQAIGDNTIMIGNDVGSGAVGAIVIGANISGTGNAVISDGITSVAIGSRSNTYGTYGADADGNHSVAIGGGGANMNINGATTKPAAVYGVAIGSGSVSKARGDMAIGAMASADGTTSSNTDPIYNYNNVIGERAAAALAIGAGASATGRNAMAIGAGAQATNSGWSTNSGDTQKRADNLAIGAAAKASYGSIAAGFKADGSGRAAVAVGLETVAQAQNMIAIGYKAGSTLNTNITGNKGNEHGIAIGVNAGNNYINGTENVAIGRLSGQYVNGNTNYAMGVSSGQYISGADNYSMGISNGRYISGNQNTALGYHVGHAVAGTGNVSIGFSSNDASKDANTNQVTKGQQVFGDYNLAFGKDAGQYIGKGTITVDTDGKLVNSNVNKSSNNISLGYEANKFDSSAPLLTQDNIAIGTNSKASGGEAIALGKGARAAGKQSISIGTGNIVSGNYSGAFGDPSIIEGAASYTLGNDNAVGSTTSDVFALGSNNQLGGTVTYGRLNNVDGKVTSTAVTATTSATGSATIGSRNYVNSENTFILGSGINTKGTGNNITTLGNTVANSVYLGADSTVTENAGKNALKDSTDLGGTTTGGATGTVNSATVGRITYGGFVGEKAVGAVSVGAANAERRIQNVAAGEISATSTDAINGSQLYAVAKEFDNIPVVYTTTDGTKVYKVGDKFYTTPTPNLDPNNGPVDNALTADEVVASVQNIDGSTTAPTVLKNVKGSLTPTYNAGDMKVGTDGKLTDSATTTSTKNQIAPTNVGTIYNNAATIGDVLNAGWNLQGNGTAIDFVKPYDTVNFADGTGTTATVENTDGKTSTVKFNVKTTALSTTDGAVTAVDIGDAFATAKSVADAINNTTSQFAGDNSTVTVKRKPSETLTLKGGATTATENNIQTVADTDGSIAIKLAQDIDLGKAGSVKAGDSTLDNTGLTIANGPSVTSTGIDAGDKVISKVANGAVDSNSTDAVNGSQLYNTADSITTVLGGNASVNQDGTVTASNIGGTGKDNINDAITAAKTEVVGTNGVTVTSDTTATDGHTKYTVSVDAQQLAQSAQLPVVYTKADGTKVYKQPDGTFNTAVNGTGDKVDAGDIIASVQNAAGSTTAPTTLANVAGNLDGAKVNTIAPTTQATAPTNINQNNAATVGDVLNAGWNLQGNGTAIDFVKPYDTVNFADGTGTTATVENTDGKTSTVKFNVKTTALSTDSNGDVSVGATDDGFATAKNVAAAINNAVDNTSSQFAGDNSTVTVKRKPSETLSITGGATGALSDKNIGTVGNENGSIVVKLSKTLTELTSAAFVDTDGNNTVINGNGVTITPKDSSKSPVSLTKDGLNNGGNAITNVNSGLGNISGGNANGLLDLSTPASGSPTVSDNTAATVGDLRNMGFVVSSDKTTGNLGTEFSSQVKNAGEVKFVGTGGATVSGKTENGVNTITVAVDAQSVAENAQLPVVYTKADGTKVYKLANGSFNTQADGNGENVEAKDVVASMQNANGSTTTPTVLTNIASGIGGNVGNGADTNNTFNNAAGTNTFIDNLTNASGNTLKQASTVGDLQNLANTPMFFSGDNANNTFARKLSQEVKIQGGQTDASKLTDNNIGVVSNGADTLTVKLAKNIDLGNDGSLTTGNTKVDNQGVTITTTDPSKAVSLTNTGLNNGGNQITNVASGLSGTTLANATGDTLTNAANIGDLKNAVNNITDANNGGGFGLKDAAGNEVKENLGNTITIKGELADTEEASAKNIRVDVEKNEVVVKLAKDLTDLNSVTIGSGNNTTTLTSTANGLNVGGDKITNVASGFGSRTPDEIKQAIANGDITPTEKTNAANIGDLLAVQNNVTNVTNNYQNTLGSNYVDSSGQLTDAGKEALVTYEVSGQKERENASIIDALVQVKEQGTKYFHVNGGQAVTGTKTNTEDSSASGSYSTAIGYKANAEGDNAIAIGNEALATGKNSISIGTENQVHASGSGAFGDPNYIGQSHAVGTANETTGTYVIGNNNGTELKPITTNNTFILGSNVQQTMDNSIILGKDSAAVAVHTTQNGGNYTYAGANDANVAGVNNVTGVVSVGNENETRQIQHVAAGVVSANSTDAINGSQLYDTHRAINNLNQNVHNMDKDLRAGIAGAAALGMQPQPTRPGKSMVSVGGTSYRNQSAVALGVSRVSDNEKWVIKVGASADTRKNYIVGGAVGYQF